jgi:hypothetical protein
MLQHGVGCDESALLAGIIGLVTNLISLTWKDTSRWVSHAWRGDSAVFDEDNLCHMRAWCRCWNWPSRPGSRSCWTSMSGSALSA